MSWTDNDDEDEPEDLLDAEDPGPVEQQTRAYIEALGQTEDVRAPLAEAAYVLARALDRGQTGMALSATSRELRETLKAISENADGGDASAALMARLGAPNDVPSPVGNAS